MKYFFLAFAAVILLVVIMAGPRGRHSPNRPLEFFPDMVRQMKVKPQSPSGFFADGNGPRRPVEGTVPMGYEIPHCGGSGGDDRSSMRSSLKIVEHPAYGYTEAPDYYNTGKMGDKWGTGIPLEVTPELLAKGQERFTINCAVCHGGTGGGNGVTSKYGLERHRKLPRRQIPHHAGRPDFQHDHQRLPVHDGLRREPRGARPLGHRLLRARPAKVPIGQA